MPNETEIAGSERIESSIHVIRGQKVMLDSDLAAIYGLPTRRLNQQLRRNLKRFPADFAFQLTTQEFARLRLQIVISNPRGGRRYRPWAFTEHGAIMLASVLNTPLAVEASVRVVRAFVHLRELLSSNKQLADKFAELESRLDGHDREIKSLFDAIRKLLAPAGPPGQVREIGFHVKGRSRLKSFKASTSKDI